MWLCFLLLMLVCRRNIIIYQLILNFELVTKKKSMRFLSPEATAYNSIGELARKKKLDLTPLLSTRTSLFVAKLASKIQSTEITITFLYVIQYDSSLRYAVKRKAGRTVL